MTSEDWATRYPMDARAMLDRTMFEPGARDLLAQMLDRATNFLPPRLQATAEEIGIESVMVRELEYLESAQ